MAGMRFTVRVKPGSSRTRVGGAYGEPPALIVAVNAPAVDGRANDAVIAALAEAFGARPRELRLVSGQTGRTKVIELDTGDSAGFQTRLAHLLGVD